MIRKQNRTEAGFTLVEIMIVVAIIALLATIAVPSFLRARKRSQATKIVNDARIYEAAIDQWAIEYNKVNSDTFEFSNVSDYIKASTELVRSEGKDILNKLYITNNVEYGVKVNDESYTELSDVTRAEFWSSYAP